MFKLKRKESTYEWYGCTTGSSLWCGFWYKWSRRSSAYSEKGRGGGRYVGGEGRWWEASSWRGNRGGWDAPAQDMQTCEAQDIRAPRAFPFWTQWICSRLAFHLSLHAPSTHARPSRCSVTMGPRFALSHTLWSRGCSNLNCVGEGEEKVGGVHLWRCISQISNISG